MGKRQRLREKATERAVLQTICARCINVTHSTVECGEFVLQWDAEAQAFGAVSTCFSISAADVAAILERSER